MEAMYLGVPCVMRAVDGNDELVRTGVSGVLFESDEQIAAAMMQAADLARAGKGTRTSLLPEEFRQAAAARVSESGGELNWPNTINRCSI